MFSNSCGLMSHTHTNVSSHPRKDLSAIFSSTLFANILSGLQQNRSCGSIHASLFSVGKTPFSLHFLLLDLLRAARRCFLKLNLASYLLPLLYRKLIDYGIPWKIKTNWEDSLSKLARWMSDISEAESEWCGFSARLPLLCSTLTWTSFRHREYI